MRTLRPEPSPGPPRIGPRLPGPPTGRSAPGGILVVLGLTATMVTLLLVGGFQVWDVRAQVVVGATVVILVSLTALRIVTSLADATNGISYWRLGPWYLLWGALAFGLASITWLTPRPGSAMRIELSSVVSALAVVSAAIVLWTIGYLAGPPAWLNAGARRGMRVLLGPPRVVLRSPAAPWILYGVGIVARLSPIVLTGRLGYLGDSRAAVTEATSYSLALSMASMLTLFAIAALAYQAFTVGSRKTRTALWGLVGIEIVVGALAGGKESFVLTVLAVLIPYGAAHGRLPVRVLVVAGLAFLALVVPFNIDYRQVVRNSSAILTPEAAIAVAPQVFDEMLESGSIDAIFTDSTRTLLYRVREIDNLAIIMQRTPSVIAFRDPTEFAAAPLVALIPRAIWPDKPIHNAGYEFSREYYSLPGSVFTSSAITPVGDLYRHGGLPVVAIGMVLLGVAFRLFDSLLRPESDPRAICFLLMFLPVLVKSEVDIFGLLLSLPSGVVTAVIGARLLYRAGP